MLMSHAAFTQEYYPALRAKRSLMGGGVSYLVCKCAETGYVVVERDVYFDSPRNKVFDCLIKFRVRKAESGMVFSILTLSLVRSYLPRTSIEIRSGR